MFVFPKTIPPIFSIFSTKKSECVETLFSYILDPKVVLTSLTSVKSFIKTGRPCKYPGKSLRSEFNSFILLFALSSHIVTTALMSS